MNEQLRIGLTGGIGSGKSFVAALLRRRGIPVYDTDSAAKRLMTTSETIRRGLTALLGPGAYLPDGRLNKSLVANYLFASPVNAARVNSLVHPAVAGDFGRWAVGRGPWVAMECAILFESHFDRLVDKVLLVCAPETVRLARIMARDGATEAEARGRMAAQMADDERRRLTPYIIENDGRAQLDAELDSLLRRMGWDGRQTPD